MKNFVVVSVFLAAVPLFSMDKLPEDQRVELKNRVEQIEFAFKMGPFYFAGSSQTMGSFIASQIEIIEKICDAHAIAHPRKKTERWLNGFKEELCALQKAEQQKSSVSVECHTCDITGLDKADVLKALYDVASGQCFLSALLPSVSREDCCAALAQCYIDYFRGKALKVNLRGDTFDTFLYDREYGAGAAQRAIEGLRKKS